jgi:cytidylate kinase
MVYRLVTVARECGSGGGSISRLLGERLGWNVLDHSLIADVARIARVDPRTAERYDECVDSWLYRVGRKALWRGAFEGVATPADASIFDAESMAEILVRVVREAGDRGNCVIVGRGGQCILQARDDVFHVYVYAPLDERIRRLQERGGFDEDADAEQYIETTDQRRAECIRRNFHQEWTNCHLYQLMISSSIGEERVVDVIIRAMREGSS